jgi:hypothetical protein
LIRLNFEASPAWGQERVSKFILGARVNWKLLIILSLVWLWPVPSGWGRDAPTVAGHYYLQGVHEVGSELLLYPDGRFQYFLAYGAYDENASGNWRVDGEVIVLNTSGGYTAPRFTLKQSLSKPEQPLTILVQDKTGRGIPGIDVMVDYGGTKPEGGYTQYYGWQAPSLNRSPQAIGLGIKMYNLQSQWFKVGGTQSNYFVFTFDPGDLGKVQFHDTPLRWDNGALIMDRRGQTMRYVRGRSR